MTSMLIVKELAAIADIATIGDLNDLTVGQVIAIGDGQKVLGVGSVAADFKDIQEIVFTTKLSNGIFRSTVPIRRKAIQMYNRQDYVAPQNKVITLGGVTAQFALDIPNEGEGNILVKNLSYNHAISTARVNVSLTKKSGETPEQYVDRLVLKLNSANGNVNEPFFVAAKVKDGTSAYLGITYTTTSEHVDLFVGVDGILEGSAIRVTQQAKVATGKGIDIVAMEKDISRHTGYQGYESNSDLWYSQPLQAQASDNFNVFTLTWDGIGDTPTAKMYVAKNTCSLACTIADAGSADMEAFLALMIGQTYTVAGGAEVGAEADDNAIDNA